MLGQSVAAMLRETRWNICFETWHISLHFWSMCFEIWNICFELWNICFEIWRMCFEIWSICFGIWSMRVPLLQHACAMRVCILCHASEDDPAGAQALRRDRGYRHSKRGLDQLPARPRQEVPGHMLLILQCDLVVSSAFPYKAWRARAVLQLHLQVP